MPDDRDQKVIQALKDPQYVWRTLGALQRESGMSEPEVIAALWRNSALVVEGSTPNGEKIWALRERYWKESSGIFNIISNTSTSSGSGS